MEGAARARVVAARRDDRRAGRRARRHDAHDPPRSRRAAGGRLRRSTTSATTTAASRWRLDGQVLKGLETGFTLAELCALYLSRNLLESVAGTPFQRDLTNAFARLEKMLSPRMRQFLDRLPSVLAAKPGPRARGGDVVRRHRGAAARSHAALPRHDDAVSLGVERAREGLRGASVSAGLRAGRAVPAGLRARLQGRPHVRRRPHRLGLAREADVHAASSRSATMCSPIRSASTPGPPRRWRSSSTPASRRTSAPASGTRRSRSATPRTAASA